MHPKPVAIILICVFMPVLLNGCDGESARNDSQSNPTSRPASVNDELVRRLPVPIAAPNFSLATSGYFRALGALSTR